jgi:hypothetical protein
MLTQDKPKLQLSTHEPVPGAINPSRQIIADDVLYLRDYTIDLSKNYFFCQNRILNRLLSTVSK